MTARHSSPLSNPKIFYGWYIVIASMLIIMYSIGTILSGFTAAFEPIAREFGWSYTQISLASSIRGLEVSLLVPVTGMIIDRWGPRVSVMGGAVLSGLGMIMLSRINSLAMFYLSFIVIACGMSGYSPTLMTAFVSKWFRKRASLAMGLVASGVSLGGLLIPVITIMIDSIGWRQSTFFVGLGQWLIIIPLSFILRHKPEQYGLFPDGANYEMLSNDTPSVVKEAAEASIGIRDALFSKPFWIISLSFAIFYTPITALGTHIMPYLSEMNYERSISSLIASALPLMTIVGRIGFGYLGDRMDKIKLSSLSFILTSSGLLLLCFTGNGHVWIDVLFVIVYSTGWGGAAPMIPGLLGMYYGKGSISSIMGFAGSVMMLGVVSGAPLAGMFFDIWGNYQPVWLFFAFTVFLTTIFFVILLRRVTPKSYEALVVYGK